MIGKNELLEKLLELRAGLEGRCGEKEYALLESLIDDLSDPASIDFKAVLDNLIDGVYVTDENAVTRYVNPAYCRHTAIEPEQIVGRSVADIVEEGVLFRHAVSTDVIKWKRNVTGAGLIRNVGGHSIHGYVTGVPLFDESGKVTNVVVSVFDAEKLKRRWSEFRKRDNEEPIQILESFGDSSDPIIGSDAAISEIRRTIYHAAPTDVTVLITGESGVGKEAVADRIYACSNRTEKPYVKVNCTAIPINLLESELFGYEKGAFTGARAGGKIGLFELANEGTILLDEIGELPIELQTKLLRVLQQKEITRLGGTKTIPLDVRVIAATNANLKKKILSGEFREDLYYRLAVIPIHIPPLRERRGDVTRLLRYYFNEYTRKHERNLVMSDEALFALESYSWPGNVRELQNVLEYMVIVSESATIGLELVRTALGEGAGVAKSPGASLSAAVEELEKKMIEEAISEYGGVRRAAVRLGVNPSTVSRKAKKYGISLPE